MVDISAPVAQWFKSEPTLTDDEILERITKEADEAYQTKVDLVGAETFHQFERNVMLQSLDTHWREHLAALDHLRQGIHLRGYAQKNPKQEYKREAFELFGQMLDAVKNEVTKVLMTVKVQTGEQLEEAAEDLEERAERIANVTYTAPTETGEAHSEMDESTAPQPRTGIAAAAAAVANMPRVGRNDPCPCGSGKKYKHCHGQLS